MDILNKMSKKELESVPKFVISNEHGSMTFFPPKGRKGLDLTEVDLSDFKIEQNRVHGYLKDKTSKPNVFEKLNLPVLVTLNSINMPNSFSEKQATEVLKKSLNNDLKKNLEDGDSDEGVAEFISYEYGSKTWKFKIPHFSSWGFDFNEIKTK